jgi:tetratricopeptide (TPR) repeat protein
LALDLLELDENDAALEQAQQALKCDASSPDANLAMGEILSRNGDYRGAISYYEKLRNSPLRRTAAFAQGAAHFLIGEHGAGLALLAEADPMIDTMIEPIPLPDWDGSRDPKLHLVLCGEYGFGDILHFIRYARAARERVGKLTLSVPYHLLRLITANFPDFAVHVYQLPEHEREKLPPHISEVLPPDAGARCFYMNLPHLLAPFDARAGDVPYIKADAALTAEWEQRLSSIPHPRIGIIWAGNPRHQNDHNRSVPFAALAPLIEFAKPHLVSLQRDGGSDDAKAAGLFDATPYIHDFADSAAAMAALDLVITIDSAPAHLAGSMGIPVWVLLPFSPDWRWEQKGEKSLWYQSMKLYRQQRPKDWESVLNAILGDLNVSLL